MNYMYPPAFCQQTSRLPSSQTEAEAEDYPHRLGSGVQGTVYANDSYTKAQKCIRRVWLTCPKWIVLVHYYYYSQCDNNNNNNNKSTENDSDDNSDSNVWIQTEPYSHPTSVHHVMSHQESGRFRVMPLEMSYGETVDHTHTEQLLFTRQAEAETYASHLRMSLSSSSSSPSSARCSVEGPWFYVCSCTFRDLGLYLWRLPVQLLDAYVSRRLMQTDVFTRTRCVIRILDEYRVARSCGSSLRNIAQTLDSRYDCRQYIVMECIQGGPVLNVVYQATQSIPSDAMHQFWMHVSLQVFAALMVMQDACEYKHNDLTIQNVFFRHSVDLEALLQQATHGASTQNLGVIHHDPHDDRSSPQYWIVRDVPCSHQVVIGDHGFASVNGGSPSSWRIARCDMEIPGHLQPSTMGPWSPCYKGWEGYDIQTFLNSMFLFGSHDCFTEYPIWTYLAGLYNCRPSQRTPLGRPRSVHDVSSVDASVGFWLLWHAYAEHTAEVTAKRWRSLEQKDNVVRIA